MTIVQFIADSPLPTFGDPRDRLSRDLVTPFTAFDLSPSEPFMICMHKGFVERVPVPFLRRAFGASRIVHADPVFILFEVDGVESENASVHVYQRAMHAVLHPPSAMP